MTDEKLSDAILTAVRTRGELTINLRDLAHLSDRPTRHAQERHVDQTLQRLRRKGLIAYDRKTGWRLVEGGGGT
jgi:hypothetical protein